MTDCVKQLNSVRRHDATNKPDNATRAHIEALDWNDISTGDRDALERLQNMRPTCVLAADVVYDPTSISPLVDTLWVALQKRACSGPQPFALVASTVRNPDTYDQFLRTLESRKLRWKMLDLKQTTWPNLDLVLFPSVHNQKLDGAVSMLHIEVS